MWLQCIQFDDLRATKGRIITCYVQPWEEVAKNTRDWFQLVGSDGVTVHGTRRLSRQPLMDAVRAEGVLTLRSLKRFENVWLILNDDLDGYQGSTYPVFLLAWLTKAQYISKPLLARLTKLDYFQTRLYRYSKNILPKSTYSILIAFVHPATGYIEPCLPSLTFFKTDYICMECLLFIRQKKPSIMLCESKMAKISSTRLQCVNFVVMLPTCRGSSRTPLQMGHKSSSSTSPWKRWVSYPILLLPVGDTKWGHYNTVNFFQNTNTPMTPYQCCG